MSLKPSKKKKWWLLAVPLLGLVVLWSKPSVSVSNAITIPIIHPILPLHLCTFPTTGSVNVPLIGQQSANWCWAACTEMVMSFMGHDVPQCTLAQQVNSSFSNCCVNYTCTYNSVSPCDTPGNPAEAFSNNNFVYDLTPEGIWPKPSPSLQVMPGQPLPWGDVCRQIYCYGRPVIIGYGWVNQDGINTGGHWVVATGYMTLSDGTQWLDINDPDSPQCIGNTYWHSYDYVVGNTGEPPYYFDHVMSKFVYNIAPNS